MGSLDILFTETRLCLRLKVCELLRSLFQKDFELSCGEWAAQTASVCCVHQSPPQVSSLFSVALPRTTAVAQGFHHFPPTSGHFRFRWGRRDPVRPVPWSEPLPAHLPSLSPSHPHPDPRPSWCSLAPQGCCYLRALDAPFSTWNPFPGGLPVDQFTGLFSTEPFSELSLQNQQRPPLQLLYSLLRPALFCSSTHTSVTFIMFTV